jgi:hypothetical protein
MKAAAATLRQNIKKRVELIPKLSHVSRALNLLFAVVTSSSKSRAMNKLAQTSGAAEHMVSWELKCCANDIKTLL